MFGVAVWIFATNKSFVYTCIKIKTIEQKIEATLFVSRLNPLLRLSLMFRTANGVVLQRQFQMFFKMNESFVSFKRYVSIKTFSNSKVQVWHNCTDVETATRVVIG